MNNLAIAAALLAGACKYLSKYIGPAAVFLAWRDGVTIRQAHSRSPNSARSMGYSWPHRTPSAALQAPDFSDEWQGEPLEILIARESTTATADAAEVETHALNGVCRVTQHRARQIAAQSRAVSAVQMPLFVFDGGRA